MKRKHPKTYKTAFRKKYGMSQQELKQKYFNGSDYKFRLAMAKGNLAEYLEK